MKYRSLEAENVLHDMKIVVRNSPEDFETATSIAEWAANEFECHHWLDDENHWVWELALEAFEHRNKMLELKKEIRYEM